MKLKTYSFVFGLIGSIIGLVTAMIHYIVVIANGPNFNAFYIPESIIILICGIGQGGSLIIQECINLQIKV